jgi:hypothetical protein
MKTEIIERLQRHALGQFLTSWEDTNGEQMSYEEVIEVLYGDGTQLVLEDERIIIWEPFEEHFPAEVAELIENLYEVLHGLATDLLAEVA